MHKFYFKEELIFPFEEEVSEEEKIEQKIKEVHIVDKMIRNMIKNSLVEILNNK